MNETRNRLGPLDSLDPPDLWQRAAGREPSTDGEMFSPHRSRAKRVATGVVALSLFAAAAGLTWQAFMEPKRDLPQATPSVEANLITVKRPMDLPITLSFPADWSSRLVSQSTLAPNGASGPPGPPVRVIGIVIANTPNVIADDTAPASSPQALPDLEQLPSDSVVVRIVAVPDGAPQKPGPDSPLPLRLDDAMTRNGGSLKELDVRIGGVDMTVLVSWGPDAPDADMATAAEVVSSIAAR